MIIKIKKDIGDAIGFEHFTRYGINEESWEYGDAKELHLTRYTAKQIAAIRSLFETVKSIRGVGVILKDIDTWLAALRDASTQRARTVQQFESLAIKYFSTGRHHVYRKYGEVWVAAFIDKIDYHPAYKDSRGDYHPAYTQFRFVWEEFEKKHVDHVEFYESDTRSMTVVEALGRRNMYVETPELRAEYEASISKFSNIAGKIGKQFFATGTATDNVDGNGADRWRGVGTVNLVREGQPSRMVVDVFFEEDERERDRVYVDEWFWRKQDNAEMTGPEPDEFDGEIEEPAETDEEIPNIEIPTRPYLAMFDLAKHMRLRVHVANLTEYVYDRKLSDKLVIEDNLKALVGMLVEHKDGGFKDVVRGKSGGAVVLLTGPPGVGKTLTAEVYAETEERALYSVQCSQLGLNANQLEEALLKVFVRARRWNAVLLLDEADVYVHERGNDMEQNAIVGVFLRVLEYQSSVLFMTTNRPDDVDDAIASRCVARLVYGTPGSDLQAKIWRMLADENGARLTDETIRQVAEAHPFLSGRDVKNLLKLAMLVQKCARAEGEDLTFAAIEFVMQFKPTRTYARG